jgi:3-methyladenine DNA glycosylase AlkD
MRDPTQNRERKRADGPDFLGATRAALNKATRAPDVHALAPAVYRNLKPQPAAVRNRFCTELWKSGRWQEWALACYVYRRFARTCGTAEWKLFERWLNRYVDTWGACDALASWLLAACIENQPELSAALPAWTASRDRWKRRAAAVALVYEAKRGRSTERIFEVAGLLIHDADDMVRKGVGWLLKETYPKKPREVVRFLRAHPDAPRLVVRYAAEKMTAGDRQTVMRRTV